MKSKKIHNKKKLTKKYKIKLEKKIKNLFTKKIKQIYNQSNKFNKSKKFKKKYKKYLQLGGDGGITGDTTKFLQYSGTGNVAPGDTKGGQLRAAETIGEAVGMLAVDIPVVSTQYIVQESLDLKELVQIWLLMELLVNQLELVLNKLYLKILMLLKFLF
jgi:hypothetical protein